MRLGALSAGSAVAVILFAPTALQRVGQVQFIHSMATFACATFMNIGAKNARWAAVAFLTGNLLWCLPAYAAAGGAPALVLDIQVIGLAAYFLGWSTLAWSARTIDLPA